MPAVRYLSDRPRLWARALAVPLPVVALACWMLAAPILVAPAGAADTVRTDNVFGTTREGMDNGRDPASGDVIMRVSPPDPGPAREQPEIHLEIRPEITLPPSGSQPRGSSQP